MDYISFLQKMYLHILLPLKKYIIVQLASGTQRQQLMLPDSSTKLIIAISINREVSVCVSRLSKAANLLLKKHTTHVCKKT